MCLDKENNGMKDKIVNKLDVLLDTKIKSLQETIVLAKESRDNESKSSVGDKYETTRAMMHIEIAKNERQLALVFQQKAELQQLQGATFQNVVAQGALVYCSAGVFFISIAHGKLKLDQETVIFVVSPVSPVGKILLGRKTGETVVFQSKEILINKVE